MEGGADEDMADGMQCSDHPYRTNPHGICPLCLQEKLGKLLSSSLPLPLRPSSPPSPTSFRSDHLLPPPSSSTSRPSSSTLSLPQSQPNSNAYHHHHHSRRSRLHFLSTKKKHKKKPSVTPSTSASAAADVVFKRSKSTATPRRGRLLDDPGDSPRKRNGFWSFLHLSSKSSSSSVSAKKPEAKSFRDGNNNSPSSGKQKEKCEASSSSLVGRKIDIVVEEDDETCNSRQTSASSFERKVSRSRSVGCGSRSFSGDLFERISTGFGDCALRRVESQREGKPKVAHRSGAGDHHHSMKERARCGGLFSGFMLNSSSSSSSSSSYLVSSSNDDQTTGRKSESMALSQSRGRYWGWAFASPMRVFTTKPSNSKDVKNNATPNLSAIPSLLAVGG
ncbi:hypothetical protein QN277_026788 [Acacia crassicarpa]|uniref:Uncharacterized protein n=1 Tax=Acacia crassicarpa TaxID=499986 RepID=A0AAE1MFP7_9FABA|nr:hypothetical protein QN277_026788 [Acacia crassicarpa]